MKPDIAPLGVDHTLQSFPASTRKSVLLSWPTAAVALLLIQAAVSFTLPDGIARTVCSMLLYGFVLVLATAVTAWNAVRSRDAIRLFWSFLAMALGVLSVNPAIWIYYAARPGNRPPDLMSSAPVILHIVLMIAAVASRPHLKVSRQRGRRTTLNFLLLLFFWIFVYAMILAYPPYPIWGPTVGMRFEGFYLAENFFLIAILAVLTLRIRGSWKTIYGHFLGASVLYVLASLATNIPMTFGKYHPGLTDIPLTLSACWFVWMAVRGQDLAAQLEQSVQPDITDTKYTSLLAMLSVVAIPVVGLWEQFRTDETYRTHELRLLIVLFAVLFLGVGVFVEEYLTNRDLFSEAGMANERFRLAARAGAMYAFEWDAASERYTRSEEFVDVLGSGEAREITDQQMLASVYPDDRKEYLDSIGRLTPEIPTGDCSYRVMRCDGSIIWLGRSMRGFFDEQGKIQRIVGMVTDLSESKRQEALIRESEERLRVAAEVGRMYAWEWDPATDVVQRSAECAGILGNEQSSPEGMAKDYFTLIHPGDRLGLLNRVSSLTPNTPDYRTQYRRLRADGTVLWLEESGHATFDGDGKMVRLIGMTADITEQKQAEEAVASMSQRLIQAEEEERARIARELHDNTNQRLALLAMKIEQLKHDLPEQTDALHCRMDELRKETVEISSDVRNVAHELHPPALEYVGLTEAASVFCREFGKQRKVQVDWQTYDMPSRLSPPISLCLFRVLQEALQNSVKHSGARHFEVQLWGTPGDVHLMVSDSGVGFHPEAAKESRGLGLISMQERVRLVKGTFSIESQPQCGTTIHVSVPHNSEIDSLRMIV